MPWSFVSRAIKVAAKEPMILLGLEGKVSQWMRWGFKTQIKMMGDSLMSYKSRKDILD